LSGTWRNGIGRRALCPSYERNTLTIFFGDRVPLFYCTSNCRRGVIAAVIHAASLFRNL
jgi:hypothetical protein